MSEDSLTDKLSQTRPVLGDLTNRKRDFLAVSGDSGRKSGDGFVKIFKAQSEDSQFAKQLRMGVDKFIREKTMTSSVIDHSEKGLSLFKDKQPCRSTSTSTDTDVSQEITESLVSNLGVQGPLVTVCKDSEEGLVGICDLVSEKSCSVEWSKLPNQGSQFHESGRSLNLKGDGCANSNVDDDILKACSCSFCLKAAYIWSDLQYQDIKGRIAALKKSQKEANTLAQSSCKGTKTDGSDQENPIQSSKLDSDLSGHWKSLFCHMEDVLANESSQLQASFLMLNDLRENCKTDLENTNGKSSQK